MIYRQRKVGTAAAVAKVRADPAPAHDPAVAVRDGVRGLHRTPSLAPPSSPEARDALRRWPDGRPAASAEARARSRRGSGRSARGGRAPSAAPRASDARSAIRVRTSSTMLRADVGGRLGGRGRVGQLDGLVAVSNQGERLVSRDPEEPRAQMDRPLLAGQSSKRAVHRVLKSILSVVGICRGSLGSSGRWSCP